MEGQEEDKRREGLDYSPVHKSQWVGTRGMDAKGPLFRNRQDGPAMLNRASASQHQSTKSQVAIDQRNHDII